MTTSTSGPSLDPGSVSPPSDVGQALDAAKPPVGTGFTPLVGQVVAVLLIGLGVVGVQEALARTGLVDTSWITWTVTQLDGRGATFSMLVLFVVLGLVGLALLLYAFKPRPRKTLALRATTGVYLKTGDLARIARARVDGAEGVVDIDSSSSRSKLMVGVTTVQNPTDDEAVTRDVESRLQPVLGSLSDAPRLRIDITHQDLT